MECEEFLDGYSAYRDGRLEPSRRERFRDHLETCGSCARYDRVVDRGTEVLRSLPRPEPSSDFLSRLRHRLYHVRDGIPMHGGRGGGVAAAAVAAAGLLVFAWLPFATQMTVEVELPAVAVEAPERAVEPADASADLADEAAAGPRFLEPGVLVGGTPGEAADGWYEPGLWAGGAYDGARGMPAGPAGASFLAGPGGSAAGR